MRNPKVMFAAIAACVALLLSIQAIPVLGQAEMAKVPEGQKTKILGIINSRDGEKLVMTALDGSARYTVHVLDTTSVKTNTKGIFRGGETYSVSYLLRGLRIEVEGTGNSDGEIAAKSIRFNETDLRTAQSLESRIDPVEQKQASNTGRITAAEENAKRMSGQIDENAALAAAAKGTADEALAAANLANTRLNGLDEYEPIKTIVVPFAVGSYTIGPKGRAIIDEAAAWAATQDRKGWMFAVVGFADSTGKTAANKTLSERRANSVIGYLVGKHNLQLTRLIQPFGAGVDQPIASNATAAGRAQNRRVEIRVLLNKGIAGKPTQ